MKKSHMKINYTILENSDGQYEMVLNKAHYIVDSIDMAVLVAKQVIESGEF